MVWQEQAGYALASWARFDGAITDELQRAVTGAFALVAAADGDLASEELERFATVLKDNEAALAPLDMARVQRQFRDVTGALLSDPAAGRNHALELIAAVASNPEEAELVRSAAEIAVAADNRTLAQEQQTLAAICTALNLEPR